MSDLPENQKIIFDFLLEHLRTKEPFTKKDIVGLFKDWKKTTPKTYWSKEYKPLLIQLTDGRYRVSEVFRKYATEEKFKKYTSQKRTPRTSYRKIDYDKVIIFDFFMPLVNERYLRDSLDTLFYKDTILTRLKNIVEDNELKKYFKLKNNEEEEDYYERICNWISEKFIGYSISHVSGRFRNDKLRTHSEVVVLQKIGLSYLIDETTAIVRFIFPVGQKKTNKIPNLLDYFKNKEDEEKNTREEVKRDEKRIRWLFNVLFVCNIVELVGEDEIWMVESGMRNHLHKWRAVEEI